ncbi:aldo/keto reductase [Olsenella sp. YH-ols2217]|uniref:Aldo/keto reductase n=1 Tax=Kribbibacterium absianum TaxID=3044210 RepID=A0ABT6ZN52_9ACTN|nr:MULTISPECIES: aldo/keto reductase [unclassified Olsenella]MDJ1122284.1 aldo/keto reductase [Olsenella sp. YH-ols2216]MDJ1130302.1 aldo/keto reductase [Olsenella sp. YH-ols2217]
MEYQQLSNGVQIPVLGYGVYQIPQEDTARCVTDALACGYRLIDTAQSYFNEEQVGDGIKASGVPRDEIFLTTKVWIEHYGHGPTRRSVEESLRKLRTNYLDLVLLHQDFSDVYGAWQDLEDLLAEGTVRAIGVSNFMPDRLVDLCSFANVRPMVNQIETHPLYQRDEDRVWMAKYGIAHEAWAPFGEVRGGLFTNPVLEEIGPQHGKSPAQVILRWDIQRGTIALPKSVRRERMEQNADVFDFELSEQDMARIADLDTKTSSFFSFRDPAMVEWFAHMVEERKAGSVAANEKKAW